MARDPNRYPRSRRHLTQHAGIWKFCRRVPPEFAALDPRGIIRLSTGIRVDDDPRGIRAERVANRMNEETEAFWKNLRDGQADDASRRYEAARTRARKMGFDYLDAATLATRPQEDILQRIERLIADNKVDDQATVVALLGGERQSTPPLSQLFEAYESLMDMSLADMSPDQRRKWRNPKQRAVQNLISAIGNRPLGEISRGDVLDFRSWWQSRIMRHGINITTANKDFGHLNKMLRTIEQAHRFGLDRLMFSGIRFEGGVDGQRQAFDPAFVRDRLLAPGALDGLNAEAGAIVLLIAETGLRPSEAANLNAGTIRLEEPIPHVQVRPDGRRMKTRQSERDIPLVGIALETMQEFPRGFPRYQDNAATLSATVNKFFAENDLRPSAGHSLYSLRHTFEDRLTDVEAPEKLIASLMGHKYGRPKYGRGPKLDQKQKWMQQICFARP